MAIPRLFQLPRQTPFQLGVAVPGAKAQFYIAGTTTPQAVYTTAALDVEHSNPVIADASGEFEPIYLDDDLAYRVQIKTAGDVLIYDQDNINDPDSRAPYYQQTVAESSAGVTPINYTYAPGNVLRYGTNATPGTTNFHDALESAASVGIDLYFPAGDYLVNDFATVPLAGTVWRGPGRLVTSNSHRRTWEFGSAQSTGSAAVWYVSTSGDDSNTGASGSPFRTLNRAIQQVTPFIHRGHQQTIRLADGTYSASDIAAADMPRPALGYVTGLYSGERSYRSGADLYGSLVIKGASEAGTIIETGADFTYGLYVSQVPNIALQDLTVRSDGSNLAAGLVVAHRGSYVQGHNVTVDGQDSATYGIIAESGGIAEFTETSVIDCTTNLAAFDNSLIVLSGDTSGAGTSAFGGRGSILITNTTDVQGPVVIDGLTLVVTGDDTSNRVTFQADITADNAFIKGTYVDWSGDIDATLSHIDFNVCDWSEGIIMRGGMIQLRGQCRTYIPADSASNVANPLQLLGDAQYYPESTLLYVGSGGATSPNRNVRIQAVAANATAIGFQATGGRRYTTEITANGAYTGCTLSTSSTDLSLPPSVGDVWTVLFRGSNSVALVDSTTADIASGGITLGLGVSEYNSVTLQWRSDRLWEEVARSGAN